MVIDGEKSQIPIELRHLVHRSFDEDLSDVEARQLEKALGENAELRKWYVKVSNLQADLLSRLDAD